MPKKPKISEDKHDINNIKDLKKYLLKVLLKLILELN